MKTTRTKGIYPFCAGEVGVKDVRVVTLYDYKSNTKDYRGNRTLFYVKY